MLKINFSTAAKVGFFCCVVVLTSSCGPSTYGGLESLGGGVFGAEPFVEREPARVLYRSKDGRRLLELLEQAASSDPSIRILSEDLFSKLARVRDISSKEPGKIVFTQADKDAALRDAKTDAQQAQLTLQSQLDSSFSTADDQFQNVSFKCLQDRRTCSNLGYGYLDCELTMIMCFLEVVFS